MKRRKWLGLLLAAVMVLTMVPTMAFAADGNVAKIGDVEYATIEEAIAHAQNDDTIELLSDVTLTAAIKLDKPLTFNLNEHTITGAAGASYVFSPWAVDTVFNNGKIVTTNPNPGSQAIQAVGGNLTLNDIEIGIMAPSADSNYNYGVRAFASVDANGDNTINDPVNVVVKNSRIYEIANPNASETLTAGVIVIGKNNNTAVIDDMDNRDAVLEINDSVISVSGFAVSGNGAAHGTKIVINNSELTSTVAPAIYHPQVGEMSIVGGKITGVTGIEVRAGVVNVSGGANIIATGDPTSVDPNGNGTTTTGAAIAIAQHTTKLPISVTVENGTLTGASALVANNPQGNEEEYIDEVKVEIKNGQFNGLVTTNSGGKIQASGGTFDNLNKSVNITANEVAEITDTDGKVTVLGIDNINDAIKNAKVGTVVRIIRADTDTAIKAPVGITVENISGVVITVNDESLNTNDNITIEEPTKPIDPEQPSTDQPSDKNDNEGSAQPTQPTDAKDPAYATGDDSNIAIPLTAAGIALAAMAAVVATRRRHS